MRTAYQARSFIFGCIRNRLRFGTRECQMRCHDAYNIPTDGTPTAIAAWSRAKHKFTGQWVPGAFAYWDGGDGHVVICGYRKGIVFTTDYPNPGEWNRTTLAKVSQWLGSGHTFLGFSLDNDGMTPVKFPRIKRRYP